MAEHFFGGIVRGRMGNRFSYAPKPGYGELPVTFVSFFDAARFANWLHYGRPATGRSDFQTTEGDGSHGAYDTSATQAESGPQANQPTRNALADYWIPSCDEWVKAAFYDPATKRYRRYAFGEETGEIEPGRQLRANYCSWRGWALPPPHLAVVTAYASFPSALGTVNQGGNVIEWAETPRNGHRMILGGSLFMYEGSLRSTYVDSEEQGHELSTLGFRIARRMEVSEHPQTASPAPPSPNVSAIGNEDVRSVEAFRDGQGMEFVRIGIAGNEADPVYGKGAVPYEFGIARFEVSNEEYADFLNAIAADGDPFGLYHEEMGNAIVGGIARTEEDGRSRFRPRPGWERRPATYLSWFDIARLANWKHFGAPRTGRQELGTTEGSNEMGAYDTRNFPTTPDHRGYDPRSLPETRNDGATYFIPSEDEWFKAAYYDPTRYGARHYWDYPTRIDTPPKAARFDAGGMSNYQDATMGEGEPFFVSNVDEYGAFESFFGTRQQGGNVWEWTEGWRSRGQGTCWRCDEWTRGLRGGSFNYTFRGLHAGNLDPGLPDHGYFVYGARLARSIDERGWRDTGLVDSLSSAWRVVKHSVANPSSANLAIAAGGFLAGAVVSGICGYFAARFLRRRRAGR